MHLTQVLQTSTGMYIDISLTKWMLAVQIKLNSKAEHCQSFLGAIAQQYKLLWPYR